MWYRKRGFSTTYHNVPASSVELPTIPHLGRQYVPSWVCVLISVKSHNYSSRIKCGVEEQEEEDEAGALRRSLMAEIGRATSPLLSDRSHPLSKDARRAYGRLSLLLRRTDVALQHSRW